MADGLGGLPLEPGGKTELETAAHAQPRRPGREGVCGLSIPVLPGITPGSGPGHLGLFGYDPLEYRIGRGILEALGINFEVGPRDVAVRGNFCTVDDAGKITDRRAGRPTTETLRGDVSRSCTQIKIPGVEMFVEPVREHRFVVVVRGDGLGDARQRHRPAATRRASRWSRRRATRRPQKTRQGGQPVRRRGGHACSRATPRPTW